MRRILTTGSGPRELGDPRYRQTGSGGTWLAPVLLRQLPIDVKPPPAFANETAALVQANGGGIAGTRTRDELNLGRSVACDTRLDDAQTQPLLVLAERD